MGWCILALAGDNDYEECVEFGRNMSNYSGGSRQLIEYIWDGGCAVVSFINVVADQYENFERPTTKPIVPYHCT